MMYTVVLGGENADNYDHSVYHFLDASASILSHC